MAVLSAAYAVLALELQEASNASSTLTSSDVRSKLSDAVSAAHRGTDSYGYYLDHAGDHESGDVIYRSNGQTKRAPYEISAPADGKASMAMIDMDSADNVASRTIYEPVCDDDGDGYAAMSEAFITRDKLYTELPLYERFISKKERDAMDDADFAGKGRSYPISKPEDVTAAAHAIGRAGAGNLGPSGIKARIVAIAKRKGWTKYLPKAWQGDSSKTSEAAAAGTPGKISLVESAGDFGAQVQLTEAERTHYPVKLISPGTGSTAHYPAKVLERDGPKVFKAGTLMFWNHPTAAEEASRPEGDLNNLAAILKTDAKWNPAGPKGPGLYAEAAVMADYAQKVGERAPHIGLSIRAGGTGTGRLVDGKPELASLDYAESVDYVTKAGRGGMALAEAARDAGLLDSQEVASMPMTDEEAKQLREGLASQQAITSSLLEKELRRDAIALGIRAMNGLELPKASKERVVESVVERALPKTADGALDAAKLSEAFIAEAKREGAYLSQLSGGARVFNMGGQPVTAPTTVSAEEAKRQADAEAADDKKYLSVMESLCGGNTAAAKFAFAGRPCEEEEDAA